MKQPLLKSTTTMKPKPEPNFFFSAYPLKALNLPETEKKTYLHIYRNKDGQVKKAGTTKILPMVNPYKESIEKKEVKKNQPDTIEHREADWFSSYE